MLVFWDEALGGERQATDPYRSCQRSRTRETRLSQGCLYRYATRYPLIKRPCFHYHPAFVGQLDSNHLGQVLPAEQDTAGNGAEVATTPRGHQLLR